MQCLLRVQVQQELPDGSWKTLTTEELTGDLVAMGAWAAGFMNYQLTEKHWAILHGR